MRIITDVFYMVANDDNGSQVFRTGCDLTHIAMAKVPATANAVNYDLGRENAEKIK
jgi:hypothetical protein